MEKGNSLTCKELGQRCWTVIKYCECKDNVFIVVPKKFQKHIKDTLMNYSKYKDKIQFCENKEIARKLYKKGKNSAIVFLNNFSRIEPKSGEGNNHEIHENGKKIS